jgi:hypothetical protein
MSLLSGHQSCLASNYLTLDAKLETSDGSTQSALPEFEMRLPDIQQLGNYYKK